ncbi:hypothetical protein [Gemmiger qucibialis]|uniref:hypothetical protein n=1 Tax=Gemmiger qucibialis TaxID=2997294 RepID=UPI0022DF7B60|nr:hypothetical protein [Gemmiger qucibialis]
MMGTLYNAKPGTNKATLTAEGAGHGEAMDVLGDTYWNTVFDFEASTWPAERLPKQRIT